MALKTRYTVVNGEILSENRSGTIRDYVPDPLGSTVALLDNTQAQQSTFSYWPYGEVKTSSGPTATPFQYVGTLGYYRDSGSKEYVRARYLDTQKGRWLTQDPIGFDGGDWDLYRYVENGPTTEADPTGGSNCPKKGTMATTCNKARENAACDVQPTHKTYPYCQQFSKICCPVTCALFAIVQKEPSGRYGNCLYKNGYCCDLTYTGSTVQGTCTYTTAPFQAKCI